MSNGKRNRNAGNGWERDCAARINERSMAGRQHPSDDDGKLIPVSKLPEEYFTTFPKIGTTRKYSRALDALKVDLTVTHPMKLKDFPYLIQNKTKQGGAVGYPGLLRLMREKTEGYPGILVVFHQETKRKQLKTGKVIFEVQDEFAILFLDDFIDMMFELQETKLKLKKYEETEINRN